MEKERRRKPETRQWREKRGRESDGLKNKIKQSNKIRNKGIGERKQKQ